MAVPIVGTVSRSRARHLVSKRTLNSPASVEAYLQAGMTPRFIERALQIETATKRHRNRLERAYKRARQKYADDKEFAERWRTAAERWSFADVNALIAEHNNWYPVERRLPLSPRTRDYVTVGGRDWRRRPLDSDWILKQFPHS